MAPGGAPASALTVRAGPPRRATSITRPLVRLVMPVFVQSRCMDCGGCVGVCPHDALDLFLGKIEVRASCTECDLCVRICPVAALESVKPSA